MAPRKGKKGRRANDSDDEEDDGDVEEEEEEQEEQQQPTAGAGFSVFGALDDGANEDAASVAASDEASDTEVSAMTAEGMESGGGQHDYQGRGASPGGSEDVSTGGRSVPEERDKVGLLVAVVVSVERHPKADRLRVAMVDVGYSAVRVVTSAPNLRPGMRVVLAGPGCVTPGSAVRVSIATEAGHEPASSIPTGAGPAPNESASSSGGALDAANKEASVSAAPADPAELAFGGRKKKKKAAALEVDSIFAALAGSDAQVPEHAKAVVVTPSEADPPAAAAPAEAAGRKAKKGKAGKAAVVDDDLDALLAELDGPAPAAPASKKNKKKAEVVAVPAAPVETAPGPEGASAPAAADSGATADADPPAEAQEGDKDAGTDGKELSAAAKKKLKKKQKDKERKAGAPEGAPDTEAAPASGKKAAGSKKPSAAVRKMQEALERQQKLEEEARLAAEEAARKEEEEARRAEEEARCAEEEAARRKEAKRERRAELKRQGLLLTGKAKQEAQRLAAMREQILKNAALAPDAPAPGTVEEKPERKKVVYDARRKRAPLKKAEEEAAPAAAAEMQAAEDVLVEEAAAAAAAAGEAAMEEAAAATAAEEPKAEAMEEDDSGDDDWETMDLDAIKLPSQAAPEQWRRQSSAEEADAAGGAAAATDEAVAENEEDEECSDEEEGEDDSSDESSSEEESSEEESGSEKDSSEEDSEDEREERLARQREKQEARRQAALESASRDDLRSPICCILGHVDTGKTKLLDNIRRTSVQEGEAGGITQQIGATYVPGDALRKRTASLLKEAELELKLPGLLIIDTPGHESFTNLRSRGSNLCDIAILVVDLMHGLEQQTVESINLLKARKTPFIVALNKVDRLFDWQAVPDTPIQEALARQKPHVRAEFEQRLKQSMLNLNEQGLNVALYWDNPDRRKYVNIVPTSAISGEGIPDMLKLLVDLTQEMMSGKLMFLSELQCTVLEVKMIEGLGTTVDVVLVNGILREGETVVICGLQGAIVTTIRSLLTPHPLKELRVRGSYLHHKEIQAAQGVKIAAQNLENAVAGTQLLVVRPDDDLEALKAEVMEDMQDIFASVDRSGEGVCVQASTLGSLEALLEFLRSPAVKIPVSGINIGPVHRRDVMRASVMLEKGRRKFAVILAFDVPVTKEASELAESTGVRIFTADIIYHLFDQFTAYLAQTKEAEQEAAKLEAVFPCVLKIMPTCIFNKKDPIVLGVEVEEGIAKVGTPICIPTQGNLELGRIASMELNHKGVDTARRGDSVALKLEATSAAEFSRSYGRHFDHKDPLVSRISRKSIDLLKLHFREQMGQDDWRLVIKLKKILGVD
ncbi:hypothetical protein WJX81_005641 [Elliptochloris bilobata]|uniref:Eukaryotic translation initiation factor 5B n=1 Tax=Elliptochloris bilobata TaxID=381761 RepID=A0AAW1RES8_9CHLO